MTRPAGGIADGGDGTRGGGRSRPGGVDQSRGGRRISGARFRIDVVLHYPETRKNLGVKCYPGAQGTAEEKISETIEDIRDWPIQDIGVYDGEGFSSNPLYEGDY